jgi:hypothetical protein
MPVSQIYSLLAKFLLTKCLLAKCLLAKWFSTKGRRAEGKVKTKGDKKDRTISATKLQKLKERKTKMGVARQKQPWIW